MAFPVDANSAYGSVREILHRNCRASEYEREAEEEASPVLVAVAFWWVGCQVARAKVANTANIAPICHNCHNCTRTSGGV